MSDKTPPPSNSVRIWMPIYIGDYLADTISLSRAEHGSYLLAMLHYWRKGESILDKDFRSITGKEFDSVSQFFSLVDNRWYHKRIDSELEAARENIRKKRSASEKAVAARRALGQIP